LHSLSAKQCISYEILIGRNSFVTL